MIKSRLRDAWHQHFYLITILVISCGSIPKGYDEGGFAGAKSLRSFGREYGLTESQWTGTKRQLASRMANISSFGVLGAAIGAILAVTITDRIGRLRTWQTFSALWMSGMLLTIFSSGILRLLLFSRLWSGFGAGGLTVVAPLYLSEIAHTRSRGMVVSVYMVFLLSFLTIGFFVNYAARRTMSADSPQQYRVVLCVPLIPVGTALLLSFLLDDTPRWLASKDRADEARIVLSKLRCARNDDPSVDRELSDIHGLIRDKHEALANTSVLTIVKEIATIPTYRTRFLLGAAMQTIAQWSGGNGITYYIPEIFRYAGVHTDNRSLISSGAYGLVKLLFTMVFTWGLVDVLGRRRCFMSGLFMQCVSHIYMAVYMGIWADDKNKAASDAAIASVFIYAVGWSIGLCTVQYLYSTEIYPTRIRSVCYAINMMIHWFFQFGVVRVTPDMFEDLHVWGAYVFWASICAVGLILLGLWAPETKGVPMERMAELFSGPWYMGWNAKIDLRDADRQAARSARGGIRRPYRSGDGHDGDGDSCDGVSVRKGKAGRQKAALDGSQAPSAP